MGQIQSCCEPQPRRHLRLKTSSSKGDESPTIKYDYTAETNRCFIPLGGVF